MDELRRSTMCFVSDEVRIDKIYPSYMSISSPWVYSWNLKGELMGMPYLMSLVCYDKCQPRCVFDRCFQCSRRSSRRKCPSNQTCMYTGRSPGRSGRCMFHLQHSLSHFVSLKPLRTVVHRTPTLNLHCSLQIGPLPIRGSSRKPEKAQTRMHPKSVVTDLHDFVLILAKQNQNFLFWQVKVPLQNKKKSFIWVLFLSKTQNRAGQCSKVQQADISSLSINYRLIMRKSRLWGWRTQTW